MNEPRGPAWYAVQAQPHGEMRALHNLERQGFDAYLPRYVKQVRHARRTRTIATAFFPRYLFVQLDLDLQRWRSVNGTFGVCGLVGPRDCPSRVPEGIIAGLRAREDEDGFIAVRHPAARWKPGDPVRISDGKAFHGCEGLFEGLNDEDRVRVLLDLLGRKVRVTLDIAALEPV
ncbi:MAG: transcriptional activator RfaH [Salinarimonas sp.]|nr:transcriptional activator RfaH [Salinarimonas sp.]